MVAVIVVVAVIALWRNERRLHARSAPAAVCIASLSAPLGAPTSNRSMPQLPANARDSVRQRRLPVALCAFDQVSITLETSPFSRSLARSRACSTASSGRNGRADDHARGAQSPLNRGVQC